jgi:hypothetical protein
LAAPSPLWYLSRGSGVVLFVFLTGSFLLGLLTTGKGRLPGLPAFINVALHQNVSLAALLFATVHVLSAILDPFARLGVIDALVPFASAYRPLWLGLGVLGGELVLVLILTSLAREAIGYGLWRFIHWAAYLSWPLALLHALGTGSDEKEWWALLIYGLCVAAAAAVLGWRLVRGSPESRAWRVAGGWGAAVGLVALGVWVFIGPLQPGWAAAAGTPRDLLPTPLAAQPDQAAAAVPAGLDDSLTGRAFNSSGSLELDLTDLRDSSYQLVLSLDGPDDSSGTLRVAHGGVQVCSTQVRDGGQGLAGSCGRTSVRVEILSITRRGQVQAEWLTGR